MTDPLTSAEIEVVAVEHPIEVAGLFGDETVTLPAGQGMILPANTPPSPTPTTIFVPDPPEQPIRAEFRVSAPLQRLDEEMIANLPAGMPIIYAVAGTPQLDLNYFQAVAAQAADHRRRLVIMARGPGVS